MGFDKAAQGVNDIINSTRRLLGVTFLAGPKAELFCLYCAVKKTHILAQCRSGFAAWLAINARGQHPIIELAVVTGIAVLYRRPVCIILAHKRLQTQIYDLLLGDIHNTLYPMLAM
jgi:hypothetical protein